MRVRGAEIRRDRIDDDEDDVAYAIHPRLQTVQVALEIEAALALLDLYRGEYEDFGNVRADSEASGHDRVGGVVLGGEEDDAAGTRGRRAVRIHLTRRRARRDQAGDLRLALAGISDDQVDLPYRNPLLPKP